MNKFDYVFKHVNWIAAIVIFGGLTIWFTSLIGEPTTCPSVLLTWRAVWSGIIGLVWVPMLIAFLAGRSSKTPEL